MIHIFAQQFYLLNMSFALHDKLVDNKSFIRNAYEDDKQNLNLPSRFYSVIKNLIK
jgi:hypothetical protein